MNGFVIQVLPFPVCRVCRVKSKIKSVCIYLYVYTEEPSKYPSSDFDCIMITATHKFYLGFKFQFPLLFTQEPPLSISYLILLALHIIGSKRYSKMDRKFSKHRHFVVRNLIPHSFFTPNYKLSMQTDSFLHLFSIIFSCLSTSSSRAHIIIQLKPKESLQIQSAYKQLQNYSKTQFNSLYSKQRKGMYIAKLNLL